MACPTKQPKTHTQVWLSEPLTSSSLLSWLLPAACQMIINSTPPKHTQAATPELHLSSAAVGLWPVQPVQTFDLQCMFHVGGFPTAPSCTHSICAVKPLTCSLVSWVATDAACGPPSPVAPAELAGSAALAGGPCCPGLPSPGASGEPCPGGPPCPGDSGTPCPGASPPCPGASVTPCPCSGAWPGASPPCPGASGEPCPCSGGWPGGRPPCPGDSGTPCPGASPPCHGASVTPCPCSAAWPGGGHPCPGTPSAVSIGAWPGGTPSAVSNGP